MGSAIRNCKTEAWGIPCRRLEMQAVGICRVPQPRKSGPRSTQLSPVLPVSRCAAWHALLDPTSERLKCQRSWRTYEIARSELLRQPEPYHRPRPHVRLRSEEHTSE